MDHLKYLWFTDTHLDKLMPWNMLRFVHNIRKHNPHGIFLTGDISVGPLLPFHLSFLAKHLSCPIYFVLGNHDYHFSNLEKQHNKIRELCKEYPNLIWLTQSNVISLNEEVALIGAEGWYDARLGDSTYIKYTPDWFLIRELFQCKTMEQRIEMFRELSTKSCESIRAKIESALSLKFKTIYLLTHFPPWKEATRDEGTFMEKFWLPYNVNLKLGQTIEEVMSGRKKRQIEIFCGHTHHPEYIRISRNIRCQVGAPNLKPNILYA